MNKDPITLADGTILDATTMPDGATEWIIRGNTSAEMTDTQYDEFVSLIRERARNRNRNPVIVSS